MSDGVLKEGPQRNENIKPPRPVLKGEEDGGSSLAHVLQDDQQPTMTESSDLPPILWPHERREKPGWRRVGWPRMPRFPHIGDYAKGVEGQKAAMARLNGEQSMLLADKYEFINILKGMHKGYLTPEQILISATQLPQDRVVTIAEHFPPETWKDKRVICKPHNGKGGMGLVELSGEQLPDFISSVDQDYIVQEKMDIGDREIRYVRQVDGKSGVIQRIYDEKRIPKVKGDGVKTKRELIQEATVPWYSKLATKFINRDSLDQVVPAENEVHLSFFGTPHKDSSDLEWGKGREQRVKNMDLFMAQFVADLESVVGTELPQLAFDIGVLDWGPLEAEKYDFEAIQEVLVPFELQMPFSLWGYVNRSSKTRGQTYRSARLVYGPLLTGEKGDFQSRQETHTEELE